MGKANPSRSRDTFSWGRCGLEFQRDALHLEIPQPALANDSLGVSCSVTGCGGSATVFSGSVTSPLAGDLRPAADPRTLRSGRCPSVPGCHPHPSKEAAPSLQRAQCQDSEVVPLDLPAYHADSFKPFSNRSPSCISKKTSSGSAGSCQYHLSCHET